jgi:Holliday junction DNA helicase RuvA
VIGQLRGIVTDKALDGCCVLDVAGVGYEVFVPMRSLGRLPAPPETVTLVVHTHVREEALRLYGFETPTEREAFRVLLGISGVGPKLAMAVLSDMSASELHHAVAYGDKKRFAAVSGIGKKTAERIVLELKDKLPALSPQTARELAPAPMPIAGRAGEVAAALASLGFSRQQAELAAARVVGQDDARPVETLIRQALSTLG